MNSFDDKYSAFLSDFGNGKTMVLSTAENDIVSSRMMSVIQINGIFYFQTDITFRKYHQLLTNSNVALCIDNIQIEGVCEELGHPFENSSFCECFKKCFKGSYDAYTSLKNERLFAIKPTFIERWLYDKGVPYIETFDMKTHVYTIKQYIGL